MERVWVISEELFAKRDSLAPNRLAELVPVKNFREFAERVGSEERAVLLGSLADIQRASQEFPKILASGLLPTELSQEKILFALRSILRDARLHHDLEAAENIAWSGVGLGKYDDLGIEQLGSSIIELSGARDMESVQDVLREACSRIAPATEVKVAAYPEVAESRLLGHYQLAVPVQFKGALKAHTYVKFEKDPDTSILEEVSEALLNLSDAIALAVERNQMISKAEETKAVWEASFDAVKDAVAILDQDFKILRGNFAFGKFTDVPLVKLPGTFPRVVSVEELQALPKDQSSEWSLVHGDRHYRAFLDPILAPIGQGKYVLRFHDVTEERSLTEKILAKEQVAELGILVGSVAHEINNPIGGILAIGQILQKDIDANSPLGADIGQIVTAAERCRKIVQTMLSLVRKADEEKEMVSLSSSIMNALDLLGSEAKRLQVKVLTDFSSVANKDPLILAKKNRVLQVLFHLLQHSMMAIAEKKKRENFEAVLKVELVASFSHYEVRLEDNGDRAKHDYEIQSSVAFTVSRMILEEQEANFQFTSVNGKNLQRITFIAPEGISS